MDDRECLEAIAAGGNAARKAITTLYDRYAESFQSAVNKRFNDLQPEACEDIVQETFVRVVRLAHNKNFAPPAYSGAYLWRILHNCAMDHYRQEKPRKIPVNELGADDDDDPADVLERIPGHVASEAFWDSALQAFLAFREQYPEAGEALRLAILEGWNIRELAQYLGRSEGATREFLHQARKRLRVFLEQFCHEHFDVGKHQDN